MVGQRSTGGLGVLGTGGKGEWSSGEGVGEVVIKGKGEVEWSLEGLGTLKGG